MRSGRKPDGASVAAERGTYRADRHAVRVETFAPDDPPVQPEGMTDRARAVWDEEVTRAIAAGTCEFDSTLFASFCELTAAIRASWEAGEQPPPAAHLSEHRKQAELFGLAGRKSRQGSNPAARAVNQFSRNGKRP